MQSDMSWHHPISSDRQDSLPTIDSYVQPTATTHQPSADWDIFNTSADLEHTIHALQVGAASSQSSREPSYDLFNTAPNTFGPGRFRSDSSPSSYGDNSPSLPVNSYDYLYNPQSQQSTMSPSGSTRPSTATAYGFSSAASGTISPDAVAPPSFAELMLDSSRQPSSAAPDFSQFAYQQPLTSPVSPQHRFSLPGYDIQSPPNQTFNPLVRPTLRQHHSSSYTPNQSYGPPAAFNDPSLGLNSTMVKHEELPYSFGSSVGISPAYPQQQADPNDLQSFIRPYLERYINSPNRSQAGECSIIVMSSKVAQKSYGTEKRFLCPPPTAVMVGNNLWYENRRGDMVPPKAVISISGEPSPLESLTEWSTPLGKNFDINDPPLMARENGSTTFMGRCIGKQLFISDVDDRKKKVEALVKVVVPADEAEGEPEQLIGIFPSRPIKVISKPSKKRQSAKNLELCINHGSTVSLFHRLRSQTVSTKYLCVSGSSASYKGSDGQPLPGVDRTRQTAPPSFIARTACWDSFVIYIVDVNKQTGPDTVPPPPPHADYPSPPPNAIPYNNNGMYTPIYYNQTVVLQCLISGVVSPVLIIRKVAHGTIVVGGGVQDGVKGVPDHYCVPGEVCGDPVSQLHKIALEVYDPNNKGTPATFDPNHPGASGAFLSCMGEKVNTYRPSEDRQWNGLQHVSDESASPSMPGSPVVPTTPASAGSADYFAGLATSGPNSAASTPGLDYPPSSDGGRVRRKRGSISATPKITSKGRRRVNSASSGNSRNLSAADQTMTSGALWSVDIGETAVWTVVGTDQVRYDFYIPPVLPAAPSGFQTSPTTVTGSSPAGLSQPITPMPMVIKYLPPERAAELPKCPSNTRSSMPSNNKSIDSAASTPLANKMLTIYGEHFNKNDPVTVWFGSEPSPHTEVRCGEVINCLPPKNSGPYHPSGVQVPRPIVLVRGDGLVMPTKVMYP